MDTIKINVFGEEKEVQKGICLKDLAKDYQDKFKYKIVCARIGNAIKDLNTTLDTDCSIEFLQIIDNHANRVYINSLIYLCIYAYKELFGRDHDVKVTHSIDKGICIEADRTITSEDVENIKQKMVELRDADLEIKKVKVFRRDALNYYKHHNEKSKYDLIRYNTNTYINLYKLGNLYDYFFSIMVPSTSYLDIFDLNYVADNEFVLRFPTVYQKEMVEYTERKNLMSLFHEHNELGKKIKVETLADLNKVIEEGRISDLIRMVEVVQSNKLLEIASHINDHIDTVRIVLLAGPSSSGKTTTCNKLAMYLKSFGITPKMLSMDDYFKDMKDRPRDENGNIDFESFNTLDLKLLDEQLKDILDGKEVTTPTFDFYAGEKVFKDKLKLGKNEVLIMEGIHALNTLLTKNVTSDMVVKIYLSPLTELNLDNHNRISTTDSRLLRRIVRDFRTRDCSAERTLELWDGVRKGEEENIFPYQDNADYAFNTDLVYELGVLRTYAEPILHSVSETSPYYEDALRLLKFLKNVLPIPSESIPDDSIAREFIGGSCFKV